jgi:hypothetical protein
MATATTLAPIDSDAAEAILNLAAVHGLAEVLDFLADHYRTMPECFDKPMPACVKVADELDAVLASAKAADVEILASHG